MAIDTNNICIYVSIGRLIFLYFHTCVCRPLKLTSSMAYLYFHTFQSVDLKKVIPELRHAH